MKLSTEFVRLPVRFDAHKLAAEALQFPDEDWEYHPQGYDGNSALILVSADGGKNNDYTGEMQPTSDLERCPCISQVLSSFDTVIGRTRLMRLEPGAQVPPHSDTDYSWRHRVRIHVPIVTDPAVIFSSIGNIDIHMQAGEAWVFDNWREHAVFNNSDIQRIHLVIDTTGSSSFWAMLNRGWDPRSGVADDDAGTISFGDDIVPSIRYERHNRVAVRSAAEMTETMRDFVDELDAFESSRPNDLLAIRALATALVQDWRCHWSLYADTAEGVPHYNELLRRFRQSTIPLLADKRMAGNGVAATTVLTRWLDSATDPSVFQQRRTVPDDDRPPDTSLFESPVFIVAAPRSGSTMLFEMLSQNMEFWTLGDESHAEFESMKQLHPASRNFDSNALGANDLIPTIGAALVAAFTRKIKNSRGAAFNQLAAESQPSTLRFLEKTPKNSLRIPFLRALFPNALFIFLHRDARRNIGSIIDAWESGNFVTYPRLPGWSGPPWSLLLPEGWRELRGKTLAEIAAWQWTESNRMIIEDLHALPRDSWCAVSYEDLVGDRENALRKLCEFAEVPFGPKMQAIAGGDIPHSRYTLTPPDRDKWRRHEQAIESAMPAAEDIALRLRKL